MVIDGFFSPFIVIVSFIVVVSCSLLLILIFSCILVLIFCEVANFWMV